MTDPLLLDYARSMDASLARIAVTLEVLAKIADELADAQATRRLDKERGDRPGAEPPPGGEDPRSRVTRAVDLRHVLLYPLAEGGR